MHFLSIYQIVPITLAACASCFLVPSILSRMSERKEITYAFDTVDDWQASLKASEEYVILSSMTGNKADIRSRLVKEDTGAERWRSTRTMPPTYYPPPMTQQAIDKLKEFKGAVVKDISEE
ncbi:hypothetical protein FCULG_00011132 [Fusarium culmorum]|uniref:Uncharacterized protein n=1 Tax=Fusarium culmorum TaxID=5516 RepID=A0A2T4GZJ9_FUSCU|nr:hypothetical protein FCULG_00011132 [Fusarium culmorum]